MHAIIEEIRRRAAVVYFVSFCPTVYTSYFRLLLRWLRVSGHSCSRELTLPPCYNSLFSVWFIRKPDARFYRADRLFQPGPDFMPKTL